MGDRRAIQLTQRPQLREEVTTRVILSAKATRPPAADNIRELETKLQPGVPDRIRRGTPPRDPGLGEPPPVPCPAAPPTFVWQPCDALPARAAPVYNAYFAQ